MGGFFTLSTPELRRRCQAIAVLDAIASPEWEGRRYSWNPNWDDGEQVLEGRDGQGDSLLILFRDESMAINLFSMGDQLVEVIPGAFEKFFLGEPVATLGTTSYWWRVGNDGDWCGNPTTDAPDWLRLIADGRDSYLDDAEDYFDDSLNYTRAASAVVSLIYDFTPLTRDMVLALSPDFDDWDQLAADLEEIGYPAGGIGDTKGQERVSLWTGTFASEEELEKYTAMVYTSDEAQSVFMSDFDITYYDEDFAEAIYDPEQSPIRNLSYVESFLGDISGIPSDHNSVIAVYNLDYPGTIRQRGSVTFLGSFSFER